MTAQGKGPPWVHRVNSVVLCYPLQSEQSVLISRQHIKSSSSRSVMRTVVRQWKPDVFSLQVTPFPPVWEPQHCSNRPSWGKGGWVCVPVIPQSGHKEAEWCHERVTSFHKKLHRRDSAPYELGAWSKSYSEFQFFHLENSGQGGRQSRRAP